MQFRLLTFTFYLRNSRRLRGAWSRVVEEIQKLQNLADRLRLEDVEGDASLLVDVAAALRKAASLLEMRFKYLNVVPWSFCQADTPSGAASFLVGATSRPFDQHDELTKFLYYTHRGDLEALAVGGVCTSSLKSEVSVINDTPLDESVGQG